MTLLTLHGKKVESFFSLLGEKENDMTSGLGFVLARSPKLLEIVLDCFGIKYRHESKFEIRLQPHSKSDNGFTDIEVVENENLLLIVEAKVGWTLPTIKQLEKYEGRFTGSKFNAAVSAISGCTDEYALHELPKKYSYCSWLKLLDLIKKSYRAVSATSEKQCLAEYEKYLLEVLKMNDDKSNLAYCVSLSHALIDGSKIKWIDVVKQEQKYFYPYAKSGWPIPPPTYIAFRTKGKLMSIHHVEKFEIKENLSDCFSGLPNKVERLFLLHLGPAIIPPAEVKNGKQYRAARLWIAIDALLTAKTIAEALEITAKRERLKAA